LATICFWRRIGYRRAHLMPPAVFGQLESALAIKTGSANELHLLNTLHLQAA
jgi:hypothetical protein